MPSFYVSQSVAGLFEWVTSVDDWDYVSALDEAAESRQVVPIDIRNEEFELLLQKRRPR